MTRVQEPAVLGGERCTLRLFALQESKSKKDFFAYNQIREAIVKRIVDQAMEKRLITLMAANAAGVMPAVGVSTQAFCDSEQIARHDPLRIMIANLSYVGTSASGLTLELADLVANGCANDPATTCALILFSNVSHLSVRVGCCGWIFGMYWWKHTFLIS